MNEKDDHAAGYDFVRLGEGLASSLVRAAKDQVDKAQAILDQTESLAEILRDQVKAQTQQIEQMNERFKQFGEQMLDAHRVLNGVEPPRNEDMKTKLRVLPPRPQ
jgi:archaellum component FlaC